MENVKERMVCVTDDWYPCYPGNRVRLRLSLNYFRGYYVKLAAWGMDDTAVEIEREAINREDAIRQYTELEKLFDSIPDGVNKEWFFKNGFTWF